jgi:hypothetical protein
MVAQVDSVSVVMAVVMAVVFYLKFVPSLFLKVDFHLVAVVVVVVSFQSTCNKFFIRHVFISFLIQVSAVDLAVVFPSVDSAVVSPSADSAVEWAVDAVDSAVDSVESAVDSVDSVEVFQSVDSAVD